MDITVYTTTTWPYCYQVKEFLSRRSLPFREVDVARDALAAAEMVRISGQRGVPVTVIDGAPVVGFDRPRLEQLLARAQPRRPQLGAAVADAADMADKGRTTARRGAYVGKVRAASPAARAGLRAGDVLTSLAGEPIEDAAALEGMLARLAPGQAVPLGYVRAGQELSTLLSL